MATAQILQMPPNQLKKIIIRKRKQPWDYLPQPVEHYSWNASGLYTDQETGQEWLLPNNPKFPTWINDKFYNFRLDAEQHTSNPIKSKTKHGIKDLFPYQKFIQSYIAPGTPYRGMLVYHKLGSGKTRTAIATAEPFRKAGFNIVVMLPASLTNNFVDEVKTWADEDLRLPPNFAELTEAEQRAIDGELTKQIKKTYQFVSYNANNIVKRLEQIDFTNTVVIIDEVHNLLNMMTSSQSKHGKTIYKILMNAVNCRIVALSGTPLLNFTYELALLFNILRGYMSTTEGGIRNIPLFPENEVEFEEYFIDYITEKAKNMAVFKRRIIGLVSYYCGIQEELYPDLHLHDPVRVEMSDFQFAQYWTVRQEEKNTEARRPLRDRLGTVNFGDATLSKAKLQQSYKGLVSNTFRPNSRQYCNFTFPKHIDRPKSISKATKDVLSKLHLHQNPEKWTQAQLDELSILFMQDIVSPDENTDATIDQPENAELDYEAYDMFVNIWSSLETKKECLEYLVETLETRKCIGRFSHIISREEEALILAPESHEGGIKRALKELEQCQETALNKENLPTYSAKMAKILDNMKNGPGHEGKKFIYSSFRSLEGVEIGSRVLEVDGYQRFNPDSTVHKTTKARRYAIISGTESPEHRRAIIQAFNRKENAHGEYLDVIFGTSSAAEGISLKHVRQIHIMEPWWNEVRPQQVIGRGRRIGSHLDLPEHERNVHVFRYLSVLSESQKGAIKDTQEHESTDEHVFNKAQKKARINEQFIQILKEVAVDTVLNAAHNQNLKYGIRPVTVPTNLKYTYLPNIDQENIVNCQVSTKSRNKTAQIQGQVSSLSRKMNQMTLEMNQNQGQQEKTVKFSIFEWGNTEESRAKLPGLYNKTTGRPKFVGMVEDSKTSSFKKVYVYRKDDPQKVTRTAYQLYDRISAETSNEFILRGYLVDKMGLVAKKFIQEI